MFCVGIRLLLHAGIQYFCQGNKREFLYSKRQQQRPAIFCLTREATKQKQRQSLVADPAIVASLMAAVVMKCQKMPPTPSFHFPEQGSEKIWNSVITRETIVLFSLTFLSRFCVQSDWIFSYFVFFGREQCPGVQSFSYAYAKWEEANFGTYESVNFSDKVFSHALTFMQKWHTTVSQAKKIDNAPRFD